MVQKLLKDYEKFEIKKIGNKTLFLFFQFFLFPLGKSN